MMNKMAVSKYLSDDFGEKRDRGGGPVAPELFGHLRRA
jgi:hypothetical protein